MRLQIALFLLPLAPIPSFSTNAQADCVAPPPDAVLCEDFAGVYPLANFVVATPVSGGQAAMDVGIDSEELFFRPVGVSWALRAPIDTVDFREFQAWSPHPQTRRKD